MNTPDSYNRGGLIALIGSISFSVVFFAYLSFFYKGIDLKEVDQKEDGTGNPPTISVANNDAAAAFDPSKVSKPWISTPELVAHGRAVFLNNCVVCHGQEGKGDGPAGQGLVPPPRNFVEGKWKKGGDSASLFVTLQNGIAGSSMASFSHLPKIDRWCLIHYVRSITHNKIPDDLAKLEKFAQTAQ
jgi:mono/diheme cytochrome c family protein